MKIILAKTNNRYGFNIVTDLDRVIYSSTIHYFLTPHVRSGYKYAWEACRDAWKLVLKRPYHIRVGKEDMEDTVRVDVSAEDMLTDHYLSILRDIRRKAKSSMEEDEKYRNNVYREIMMIIEEMNTIKEQITSISDKSQIKKIISQYQKLLHKYFKKEMDQEEVEKQKAEQQTEMGGQLTPDVSLSSNMSAPASPSFIGATASSAEPEYDKALLDDPQIIGEVADQYGQKICESIQEKHDDAYYSFNPNTKEITICDFSNTPILKIRINKNLNIDSVIPVGHLYNVCPFHSIDFYQKYWKPIVENVGHICIGDPQILIVAKEGTLPDAEPRESNHSIRGWNCKDKQFENIDVSFRGEKPIWILEQSRNIKIAQSNSASKYIEEDYLNAIVRCIDPLLKSIYGRTGAVLQVIPLTDMVEVDVNFGRGLGIIRLTESQIEIVSVGD